MTDALSQPLVGAAEREGTATVLQSSIVLFKAVVGTGIFALPPAIRSSGWLLGGGLVLLMAGLSTYTMLLVPLCVQELRMRGVASKHGGPLEFQDMTGAAFPRINGPITVACVFASLGAIIGFFEFAADNLRAVSPHLERWHMVLAVALFEAPLSLLRSTSHPIFRLSMAFGNVAVALAAGSVLIFGLWVDGLLPVSQLEVADAGGLGLSFGVCALR